MSRAALLPSIGDPFVLLYWFRFFENVWQDEVDKLYFYVSPKTVSVEILQLIHDRVASHPKVEFRITPMEFTDHGEIMRLLVLDCKEPHIMFIEDDGFIFGKGAVDQQFKRIESGKYDLIGSSRGSIHMPISDREEEVFGKISIGYDSGPNFWPNFLFATTELLKKTDLHFEAKHWEKGHYIKELDMALEEDSGADTFSWASIQLRTLTDKIGYCPQYKAYPHDPILRSQNEWTFSGNAKWIHAGSFSSGIRYFLRDEKDVTLEGEGLLPLTPPADEGSRNDFECRVAWWSMIMDVVTGETDSIAEFRSKYVVALERLIDFMGLHRNEIEYRKKMYLELMGNKEWMT